MWSSGTASSSPGGWSFPGLEQVPHMHVLNPQGAFSTSLWSSLCLQLSPLHLSFLWPLTALLFLNSSLHLLVHGFCWALSAWIPCSVLQPGNCPCSKLEQLWGSPCFLSFRVHCPSLPGGQYYKTVASNSLCVLFGWFRQEGKADPITPSCLLAESLSKAEGDALPEAFQAQAGLGQGGVFGDLFYPIHWEGIHSFIL